MAEQESIISDRTEVVTFSILVNENEIPQHYGVNSIRVVHEINKISYAKIKLNDGGVAEEQEFEIGNSEDFVPGNKIEIKLGYESEEKYVFKGIIIRHGIQVSRAGEQLVIEARHQAVKMTQGRKNEVFTEQSDSDIITSLLQKYEIPKQVDASDYTHPELVQYYASDWDFVLSRADFNGMLVIPDLDGLVIKKPNLGENAVEEFIYGTSIISFKADIDARVQLPSVVGYSWDFSNQELIEAQSNPGNDDQHPGNFTSQALSGVMGLDQYIFQTPANIPTAVLDSLATARLQKSKLAFTKGILKIRGFTGVNPGDMISIDGLSERFNGKMFVGGITHQFDREGWFTELSIGLSENWYAEETPHIAAPGASGLVPPIQGLSIGIVKQIHEDPDGNYRVKVAVPNLQKDNVPIWARMANFYASNEIGSFFYPEINDEVVLGFLNQDPQNPVILGMLYSKKNKPPLEPADQNPEKALVTKEKLTIHFSDQDKVITISTPGESVIQLSDQEEKISISDKHKNVVEMSSSGISLTTQGDAKIVADGNIILEAKGDIEAKATGNLKGEGMEVALKGSTKFAAEGAMAEVKGSGQTTIKGGIVMIN